MNPTEDILTREIYSTLKARNTKNAKSVTDVIVEKIKQQIGGQLVYLPSPKDNHESRNQKIVAAFNGRNLRQVCDQFNVSRATVYRIVKKVSRFRKT